MTIASEVSPEGVASDAPSAEAIVAAELALGTLIQQVRSSWKEAAASLHPGLQPMGYKIVSALVRSGPTNTGLLAEMLAIDKSVMSRQLRVLESADLVTVRPDPSDGRARILEATPAAIARVQEVRSSYQEKLREELRTWTADELGTFTELLDRLATPQR